MVLRKRQTLTVAEQLQEVMDLHGTSRTYLCNLWGISRSYLCDILHGRRGMSVNLALMLEATYGTPTALEWMTLQIKEDLAMARREQQSFLEGISKAAFS